MDPNKKGIILVVGDTLDHMTEILHQINPQAYGFLCHTNQGLAKSTEFVSSSGIDMSCCQFEAIHGLSDKRDFFKKGTALRDFLVNQCKAEIAAVLVGTGNLEALALAAVIAHQSQTILRIENRTTHLTIDSGGALLVDSLSAIVKEFNLYHYKDVLTDIEKINPTIRSSKGKAYVSLLAKLANAHYEWDCRRYAAACAALKETKQLVENTKDDFSHIYDYFVSKLQSNIEFLEKIIQDQTMLGGIDAFFNGNRRYDAADNLVCVIALANSVEFCIRARLIARDYDPDDSSKLTKSLVDRFGEKARRFFIEGKLFHVDSFDPDKRESQNATVTPGISYKPGFVDLLKTLEFVGDEFFKDLVGVMDAPENPDYLSIMQLNALRNKVVHRMGTVSDDDLPKAIKLTEYVMEKFLSRIVIDTPNAFPQLRQDSPDSLMLQASRYATHINLDARDVTLRVFG